MVIDSEICISVIYTETFYKLRNHLKFYPSRKFCNVKIWLNIPTEFCNFVNNRTSEQP